MFHFICRLIKAVQKYPKTIFFGSIVVSILSILVLLNFQFKFNLLDIFPKELPAAKEAMRMQKEYGGFGKLTVIIQSPDSALNLNIIRNLAKEMDKNPLSKLTEYKTGKDFFEKHKLLYIDLKDLEDIENRIYKNISQRKQKYNPFFVNLKEEKDDNKSNDLILADLEKKYTSSLKKYLGSTDGTTLLLNIYPKYDVSNNQHNQKLFSFAKNILAKSPQIEKVNYSFAGEVFTSASSEKNLIDQLKISLIVTIIGLFLMLIIFFINHPVAPFSLLISLFISIIWTIALAIKIFDNINIYTYTVGFILIGLGIDSGIHLLARYEEERRKKVSPKIAMEFAILGVGPTISASAFTTAASFFCLAFIPFSGVKELGIIAGLGILITWIQLMVILPSLVVKMQDYKEWKVFGKREIHFQEFKRRRFSKWPILMGIVVLLCLVLTLKGVYPEFEYDFAKMGFVKTDAKAESINRKYDNSYAGLTIVSTPDLKTSEALTQKLNIMKIHDETPTIRKIYNLNSILPNDQKQKLEIIKNIRRMLSPSILRHLPTLDSINRLNVEKITSSWDMRALTIEDLPEELTRIFTYNENEQLTFIFPNFDENNGKECRQFLKDVGQIEVNGHSYYSTGRPILVAEMLNHILPHMRKASFIGFILIFLILLIHQNTSHRVLFILTPTLFSCLWFFGILNLFNLKINPYNVITLPVLFGLSVDGTLHIYQRFREEGVGSIFFVLSRTGRTVMIATLTSVIGFISLNFSPHKGLQSVGLLAFVGLISILLSHLITIPAFMGLTERRRMIKTLKNKDTKF